MLDEAQIRRALRHLSLHREGGHHSINNPETPWNASGWDLRFEESELVFRQTLRCQVIHPSADMLHPETWEAPVSWDEMNANMYHTNLNRFLGIFSEIIALLPKGDNLHFTQLDPYEIPELSKHYIFQYGQRADFYFDRLLNLPFLIPPDEKDAARLDASLHFTGEFIDPAELDFFHFRFGERKKDQPYAPDSPGQYLRPYKVDTELGLAAHALDEARILAINEKIDVQEALAGTIRNFLGERLDPHKILGEGSGPLEDKFVFVLRGDHPYTSLVDHYLFEGEPNNPHYSILRVLMDIAGVDIEHPQWSSGKHIPRGGLDRFLQTPDEEILKRPGVVITDECHIATDQGTITITEGAERSRDSKHWMVSCDAENLALLRELNRRIEGLSHR